MTTYVLVHGAWSGAHDMRHVRSRLWRAGHDAFTPTLTGLGERSHLTSPQIDLSTHIQDVVNLVCYEDLTDIVLAGHSYGGIVVTGAIDQLADRIAHLVYIDAFVPADGESLTSIGSGPPRPSGLGAPFTVPPPERSFEDPAEAAFIVPRRTPHPVRTLTEPVHLARPLEEYPFTRTYIKATGEPRPEPGGAFWAAADRARDSSAWSYREIATNHMIPANRPEELAAMLLELA